MINKDIDYEGFFKNIECSISSDSKSIGMDHFPNIKIHIRYLGNNSIKISWDNNFGHLLWEGKFVLVSESEIGRYDTSNLKFKTSNTYPPKEIIELNKGDELISVLDFSNLPVSYETSQLIHDKKFSLLLCASRIGEKQQLMPISNKLVFNED
ncbi:MAG: hypothetical protein ACFFCM_02290 [Promethearchaeota archaeon]